MDEGCSTARLSYDSRDGTPARSVGEAQRLLRVALRRLTPGLSPGSLKEALADWLHHLVRSPEKCSALAGAAVRDAMQLGLYGMQATFHAETQPPSDLSGMTAVSSTKTGNGGRST